MIPLGQAAWRRRTAATRPQVRRWLVAGLMLLAAAGLGPGPVMACAAMAALPVHPAPAAPPAAAAIPAGDMAHASHHPDATGAHLSDRETRGAAPSSTASHPTSHADGSNPAAPCSHAGCPACLAALPAAPPTLHTRSRCAGPIAVSRAALPAGIAVPPPLGPPRAA